MNKTACCVNTMEKVHINYCMTTMFSAFDYSAIFPEAYSVQLCHFKSRVIVHGINF